jgi:two-component SAPR family response regulator
VPDILKKNQQIPGTVCWKRNVYGFVDPIQALEYFQNYSDHIKLVLSDIRMQKMNGIEFVKKVKAIRPETMSRKASQGTTKE